MAGLVLLVAGSGLGAWGAPYYMLDWGGALVMSGAVLGSAGLICMLIGTALLRIADLRQDILALRLSAGADRADQMTLKPERQEPVISPMPQPGTSGGGIGLAAAAAAAGAAALVVGARGHDEKREPEPSTDSLAEPAVAPSAPEMVASPSLDPPPLGEDGAAEAPEPRISAQDHIEPRISALDRRSLDELVAKVTRSLDAPAEDITAEPARAEPARAVPEPPTREELFARVEDAVRHLSPEETAETAPSAHPQPEPAHLPGDLDDEAGIEQAFERELALTAPADPEAEMLAAAAPVPEEAGEGETVSASHDDPRDDEAHVSAAAPDAYADLRADLNASSPAVAPAWQASADIAPQEPATAHREHVADDRDERAIASADEDGLRDPLNDVPDEDDQPRAVVASQPETVMQPEPIASDEGVVAAYTVGDSAYAMLADGRIRVTTPEGSHLFNTMDDLKAFMMARRAEAAAG